LIGFRQAQTEKPRSVVEKSTAPGAGYKGGEFLSIKPPQRWALTTVNLSWTASSKVVGFGIGERDPPTKAGH